MLQVYRRHYQPCQYKSRRFRNCKCPIWVQGSLRGEYVREALDLRSWEAAQELVRGWETSGEIGVAKAEIPTVTEAVQKYLAECEARGLKPASLKKYRLFLNEQFLPWCEQTGRRRLKQFDVSALREFRESWKFAPITQLKKLETLRAFFRFDELAGWTRSNPALALKPPKVTANPTLPFTETEIKQLRDACDKFNGNRERLRALILLLRYTGLRIPDAVALKRERVVSNRVFLYTQKTGTPVSVPVPKVVTTALRTLPGKEYLFWSGNGKLKSAIEDIRRSFSSLAVGLLVKGVSVENVAILLGNTPAIVLKHYAPWVKERQRQLVRRFVALGIDRKHLHQLQRLGDQSRTEQASQQSIAAASMANASTVGFELRPPGS